VLAAQAGAVEWTYADLETCDMKPSGADPEAVKSVMMEIKSPIMRLTMAKATPEPIAARIPMDPRR